MAARTRLPERTIARIEQAAGRLATLSVARMDDELAWFRALPADQRSWVTLVAQAGIAVARRLAAHPRRRAAADRRGLRRRPARAGPLGDPAADRRAGAADDRRRRGAAAAARRRRATQTLLREEMLLLQPRDRLRRRPGLRERRRDPRRVGRPPRGAGHRRPGARLDDRRRPAAQPARRARLALDRPDHRGRRGRCPTAEPGRAGRACTAPPGGPASTRWPACTATGWSSCSAASTTRSRPPTALLPNFGAGPVVVGPIAADVGAASAVTQAALSGCGPRPAWPAAPRPVSADALLPERALAGDASAPRASCVSDGLPAAARGRRRAARDGDRVPRLRRRARGDRPGAVRARQHGALPAAAGRPRSAARPRPTRAARSPCGSPWRSGGSTPRLA